MRQAGDEVMLYGEQNADCEMSYSYNRSVGASATWRTTGVHHQYIAVQRAKRHPPRARTWSGALQAAAKLGWVG